MPLRMQCFRSALGVFHMLAFIITGFTSDVAQAHEVRSLTCKKLWLYEFENICITINFVATCSVVLMKYYHGPAVATAVAVAVDAAVVDLYLAQPSWPSSLSLSLWLCLLFLQSVLAWALSIF
jgi:hypothetical protein